MKWTNGFESTLGGSILKKANFYNERPALYVGGETYTYQTLVSKAKSIAAAIQSLSTGQTNVAIYSYRSPSAYFSILGTLFAGCAYVPLNPRFPVARNQQIVEQAGARIFCIDKRCEGQAAEWIDALVDPSVFLFVEYEILPEWCSSKGMSGKHTYLCKKDLPDTTAWRAPDPINEENYAYLLFTSGTTGKPKGIAVSHRNVLAYLSHIKAAWPLSADDRCTQIYDQTFDVSVHDIFSCWQSGACLYPVPEAALWCPTDFVNEQKITCWGSVPSLLGLIKRFGKMKADALPHIKYSFFCGEALPTDMAAAWADACPNSKIINLYGPTEATVAITASEWHKDNLPATPILPLGRPFAKQEVAIVDEKDCLVKEGEIGNLLLGGAQIVSGYWQNDEKTEQSFLNKGIFGKIANRWYRTGDLVSEDATYGLLFHGRKDFQVKINGYRVELDEVAETLRKNFSCSWAVAIPYGVDKVTGSALKIIAWMSGPVKTQVAESKLKHCCASYLPSYMVPARIFWVETLPRNKNGKIDIKALQCMTQTKMGEAFT